MLPIDTHLRDVEVLKDGDYFLNLDEIEEKLIDQVQYLGQYLMNHPERITRSSRLFPSLVKDGYGGIFVCMELKEDNELKLFVDWKFK